MGEIKIKRIYEDPSNDDGYRVLVDRLWPRGVSKEKAHLDEWEKEIAPSPELRKWFDHIPERFPAFAAKYRQELQESQTQLDALREKAKHVTLTLLYAAKDTHYNQAAVLRDVLMQVD